MEYMTIGVKAEDIQQLKKVIKDEKIALSIKNNENQFNVWVDFEDLREEFKKMGAFLEENKLEDDNLFFREFDIDPYGLMIDFHFRGIEKPEIMYSTISKITQDISELLNTSCIFITNNMRSPVALYENGQLLKEW